MSSHRDIDTLLSGYYQDSHLLAISLDTHDRYCLLLDHVRSHGFTEAITMLQDYDGLVSFAMGTDEFKHSHDPYSKRSIAALENLAEAAKKVWEWIKKMCRKLLDWLQELWAKFMGLFEDDVAYANRLRNILKTRTNVENGSDKSVKVSDESRIDTYLSRQPPGKLTVTAGSTNKGYVGVMTYKTIFASVKAEIESSKSVNLDDMIAQITASPDKVEGQVREYIDDRKRTHESISNDSYYDADNKLGEPMDVVTAENAVSRANKFLNAAEIVGKEVVKELTKVLKDVKSQVKLLERRADEFARKTRELTNDKKYETVIKLCSEAFKLDIQYWNDGIRSTTHGLKVHQRILKEFIQSAANLIKVGTVKRK